MVGVRKKLIILFCVLSLGVVVFWMLFGSAEKRAAFFCAKHNEGYERILCIKPYVERITRERSQYDAFSFIRTLQRDGVISDCHVPLHFVGEVHFEESESLGAALATCPMGCFEGCQHGAVERSLKDTGTLDAKTVCRDVFDSPILYRQCLHGLGHGILRHNATDVHSALNTCNTLESSYEIGVCSDGVMMEYIDAMLYGSYERFLAQVGSVCDPFTDTKHLFDACINNAAWGLMVATGHDMERSLDHCLQFEDRAVAEQCGRHVQGEQKQRMEDMER